MNAIYGQIPEALHPDAWCPLCLVLVGVVAAAYLALLLWTRP